MAEKRKRGAPEKYLFKPGQSGNPGGKPKEVLELKPLFLKSKTAVMQHLLAQGHMTERELKISINRPEATMIERLTGAMYEKAADGSLPHANSILERIIGPVPRPIITQDESGKQKPLSINIQTDKLLAVMLKLQELPEGEECKLIPNLLESPQESLAPLSAPQSDTES